jgi:hypothetical protein
VLPACLISKLLNKNGSTVYVVGDLENQIAMWKYLDLKQLASLTGHS